MNDSRNTRGAPLRWTSVLLTLVLVFLVFVVGVWVGGHPRQFGLDRLPSAIGDRLVAEDRTALATQVLAILEDSYYKSIDPTVINRVEDKSVEALVQELGDPYTEYLDPVHYKAFQAAREGKYGGIGVEWTRDGDTARITKVFPEGPAARADIRAADRVKAVDGKKVTRADNFAAMDTVKGDEGTKVTLRIAREGAAERDYALVREEIRRPVVESRVEKSGAERIGYVRLDQFTDGSAKSLRDAVRRLVEQKVDGVVFDLRGNGGGLVTEAEGVAGVFLKEGAPVATSRGRRGPGSEYTAKGGPVDLTVPLVVLVDQNSASASEIVSGALKDADRALLVGTRTFGKALIQTTRTLPNGGAVKFTVASYLTPDGFDLGTRGLSPDVTAEDDPKTPADEGLAGALREAAAR